MKAKHWAVVKMFEKLGFKNVSLNSTFGSLNKVVKNQPYHIYQFPIKKAIEKRINK